MGHLVPSIPAGLSKLSIREVDALPNDGKRYEIIDGVLFMTPAPIPRHQRISRNLGAILLLELQRKGLGEVFYAPLDVVLDEHTVVQPDLLFIRSNRTHIVGQKHIEGAPDLVVEILSPSTRRTDVLIKAATYARGGVPSYWIVDPDIDRVEFFRLAAGTYVLALAVSSPEIAEPAEFPGLHIPLAEVFG